MKTGNMLGVNVGSRSLGLRRGVSMMVVKMAPWYGDESPKGTRVNGTVVLVRTENGTLLSLFNRRSPEAMAEKNAVWLHDGDPTRKVLVHVRYA